MHYPKPADQVILKWMPPLPFYDIGQHKWVCTRIFQTHLELKLNVVEDKWIERMNLWIEPHVGLIKIISHFSGAHFDDKFMTFGVASCIMVADPIFCMALFREISCSNHISNYHTVLNPYNLTYWQ